MSNCRLNDKLMDVLVIKIYSECFVLHSIRVPTGDYELMLVWIFYLN